VADPKDEDVIKLARVLFRNLDSRGVQGEPLDDQDSTVKHLWAGKAYLVLMDLSREFLAGSAPLASRGTPIIGS